MGFVTKDYFNTKMTKDLKRRKVSVQWLSEKNTIGSEPTLVNYDDLCLTWEIRDNQFRKGLDVESKSDGRRGTVKHTCWFSKVRVVWENGKSKGEKVKRNTLCIPLWKLGEPVEIKNSTEIADSVQAA